MASLLASLHALRGQCLHEQGTLDKALDAYSSTLEHRRGDGVVRLLRAAACYSQRRWAEAEAELRAAMHGARRTG